MASKKIEIKQNPEAEIAHEVMAQAIVDMSKAMQALSKSRLSRNAVIVLIKDKTFIPKSTITRVLDSLEDLAKDWLKK